MDKILIILLALIFLIITGIVILACRISTQNLKEEERKTDEYLYCRKV